MFCTYEIESLKKVNYKCIIAFKILFLIIINLIMFLIILDQFEKKTLENKNNLITKSFKAFNNMTTIECTSNKPCNITCIDYYEATDINLDECEFNYILLIICYCLIIIFNCIIIKSIIKIIRSNCKTVKSFSKLNQHEV